MTTAAIMASSKEDGENTAAGINVVNHNENFRSAAVNQESPSATPNFRPSFYSNHRNVKSANHILVKGASVEQNDEVECVDHGNQLITANRDVKLAQMMDDSMEFQSDFSFVSTSEKPK